MNKNYPEDFSLDSEFMMFVSEVAININHHILQHIGEIDYRSIFRLGKICYGTSQELKINPLRCIPGKFIVFDSAISNLSHRNSELPVESTFDFAQKLEDISQDFAVFGSLPKERQLKLEEFCNGLVYGIINLKGLSNFGRYKLVA